MTKSTDEAATRDVWGIVGSSYDDMSFSVSDALTHAAQRLNPKPGQRVLDIATGTGWSARNAARFGARVVAVDTSDGLLDAARALSRHVDPPIEFRSGNAESLPVEDRSFDAVVSTFGLIFAADHQAVARELARVLKPGGRLVLATWAPGEAVEAFFKLLAEYETRYREPPPDGPSPMDWGVPDHVSKLLSGDFDLVFEQATNNAYFESPEETWNFYLRCFGPVRELHDLMSEEDRKAFRADFIEHHAQYDSDAGIAISRPYLIVKGARSAP